MSQINFKQMLILFMNSPFFYINNQKSTKMNIVDTKDIIEINGKKYQLHRRLENELIKGTSLEFRKLFVIPFLLIAFQFSDALYFYKPFMKTMSFSRKTIGSDGFHAAIWWQTPKLIENIVAQSSDMSKFDQIKRTSKLYTFLNKSIKK